MSGEDKRIIGINNTEDTNNNGITENNENNATVVTTINSISVVTTAVPKATTHKASGFGIVVSNSLIFYTLQK